MKQIQLTNNKAVYNYCEPYIIAEIGANHNGDMSLAKTMIKSAKDNGADCAKFQSWTSKSLICREEYENNQVYNDSKKKHFGSLKEMVTKYALTNEQHYELKAYCDELDIDFASTPFSPEEARLLQEMEMPFFKIASMDINYLSYLREVASYQKPMILSTGMSTLNEIEQAVKTCQKEGNDNLILLHCIAIYPPDVNDIHLKNITMLQETFGLPVGFSDHTIGTSVPLASVALGACIIEKHFTTDKDLPGWDHEISANPEELKQIATQSKTIAKAMGNYERTVSDAEEAKKLKFRRSLVSAKPLQKGQKLTASDLTAKRPGTHIPPNLIDNFIGKTINTDLAADELLTENMFD